MNCSLKHEYPHIMYPSGPSFGGNQMKEAHLPTANLGCGLVAVADTLSYLCRTNGASIPQIPYESTISQETYTKYLNRLRRRMPILSLLGGIPAMELVWALRYYSKKAHLSYSFRWGVPSRKMYGVIAKMLSQDLPVIVSVGMAFPYFISKAGVKYYEKRPNGNLVVAGTVRGHYMTITGLMDVDERAYLRVSSWGMEYYIDFEEYLNFARKKSNLLFTNILYISKRR
ncbi:MAG: hypothetical protein K6C69_00145 [Lachnospiraceae bacterium]|nr:hypothetical protein [Lachnospiraceae bacterium]